MKRMKRMKRCKLVFKHLALAACLSGSLMMSSPIVMASGIPTFDGAAAANALQSLLNMKEQIDNQIHQIAELKAQVKAVSGVRNVGQVVNMVKDELPAEWKELASINVGSYKDIMKGTTYTPEDAAKALFANKQQTEKMFNEMRNNLRDMQSLMNEVGTTSDLKASADLQGKITAKLAVFQAQQMKLDMMQKMFELERKIATQQYESRQICLAKHLGDKNFAACQ